MTPPRTQQPFLLHHKHRAKDGQIAKKRRTHQLWSQTGWCSSRKWRGERIKRERRPLEREEQENKALVRAKRFGEQRGRTDFQKACWRMSTGKGRDSQRVPWEGTDWWSFYRPSKRHGNTDFTNGFFFLFLVIWKPELMFMFTCAQWEGIISWWHTTAECMELMNNNLKTQAAILC